MSQKIKAIEKGYGRGATYFRVGSIISPDKHEIVAINEVQRPLIFKEDGTEDILIYAVILSNGKTFCEIEGNSLLTVYYDVD